ncbi:MAG: thrombospondin type 3 repeat-containing protein [Myxococcota bacterium]
MIGVWLAAAALAGDKDRDGIKGKVDACPELAEDADGFEDGDGCPDVDNDLDRLEDQVDKCPDEPEDTDEFDDQDGCPDPDNDQDGVLDLADACPLEPEDSDDRDGCATTTLKLLTETGYLAAVGALATELLAAVAEEERGCDRASAAAERLLENDVGALRKEWDSRLARAPEGFDAAAANELLANKGEVYRALAPAVAVYCKQHGGWSAVGPEVERVYAALPVPVKKKRR